MALPLALLPVIAALAPALVKELFGDRAADVAQSVTDAAKAVFGSDDPQAIERAIAQDPQAALAFKSKLLEIQDREGERRHQERLAELGDVANARAREAALHDTAVPRLAASVLLIFAMTVVGVGYGSYLLLTEGLAIKDVNIAIAVSSLVGSIVGYVSAKADTVLGYYFGSSAGSKQKTDAMAAAVDHLAKASLPKK